MFLYSIAVRVADISYPLLREPKIFWKAVTTDLWSPIQAQIAPCCIHLAPSTKDETIHGSILCWRKTKWPIIRTRWHCVNVCYSTVCQRTNIVTVIKQTHNSFFAIEALSYSGVDEYLCRAHYNPLMHSRLHCRHSQ